MNDEMMKMTISLPNNVHRRAKAVAALQGVTVSEIVRGALENYIAVAWEEDEDVREVLRVRARISAGVEHLYDWDEVRARVQAERDMRRSSGVNTGDLVATAV